MYTLKKLMEKSKPNKLISLQKREAQIKLKNADLFIQTQYEELIPEDPHGTLPLSPVMGPNKKLYIATYTSKPGNDIKKYCIPFKNENNKVKYFTIQKLVFEDYEQMGGQDYLSSRNRPYFTKETQEALRAELLRLKNENKEIPVRYLKEDGSTVSENLPANELIFTCFEDKIYADERDSFSLLTSEVNEETSKINESKLADIAVNLPWDNDSTF